MVGNDSITVKEIIEEINYQIDGAVCYIASIGPQAGNLVFESIKSGSDSSITVVPGIVDAEYADLLSTLGTTFTAIGTETAGTGGTGTVYNVPITGGSLKIDNGITYITPEILGIVNKPIASFTGTRAVSGSLTAYLNTGNDNTGGILNDLLNDSTQTLQEYEIVISMGGKANNTRVDFIMNHVHLVIPSIAIGDVISTEIQFTALGNSIETNDELIVRYFSETS